MNKADEFRFKVGDKVEVAMTGVTGIVAGRRIASINIGRSVKSQALYTLTKITNHKGNKMPDSEYSGHALVALPKPKKAAA